MGEGADFKEFLDEASKSTDFYAKYLASVNETNEVQATTDICNRQGVLLVKNGSRIDQSLADKILQHKLLKPLEDQVKLKDEFSSNLVFGY